jgi:hypothetical protein
MCSVVIEFDWSSLFLLLLCRQCVGVLDEIADTHRIVCDQFAWAVAVDQEDPAEFLAVLADEQVFLVALSERVEQILAVGRQRIQPLAVCVHFVPVMATVVADPGGKPLLQQLIDKAFQQDSVQAVAVI